MIATERLDSPRSLADEPTVPFRCLAQIRYNSKATPATIEPLVREIERELPVK